MLQAVTFAFLAGILLLQTRAVLPPEGWLYALPLVLLGCLAGRYRILVLLCCFAAGFLWAQYWANHLLQQRLPPQLEHKTLQVSGYIASLPVRTSDRIRFELDINQVDKSELKSFPQKVRVSWYTHNPVVLRPGDKWHFSLRLHSPHRFMSLGAFDYNAWLLRQGIVATGYVYSKGDNRLLAHSFWKYPIQSMRYHLQQDLHRALRGTPAGGIVTALIIGDRSGIEKSDWDVMQRTGTAHLMAISGLHVGMVAGFVFFIVGLIWRWIPLACLHLPSPKAAAIAAWLVAFMYAGLAGFAVPTQRALLMLTVILFSLFLQRTHRPSQVIAVALLLVLTCDPMSVLSAGFWLSFSAVGLIYYALCIFPQQLRGTSRWWRMQFVISLGLAPLLILFFQQASLLAPITNLIAIPWVSLLVLPITLLSTLLSAIKLSLLGGFGLYVAAWLMNGLQQILHWFALWKFSLIYL